MSLVVLIADDNEHNLEYARQVLAQRWETLAATDGAEAVACAIERRPNLIVLDLSMPIMNGWDAAACLRADERTRRIPLVACTAHAMTGDLQGALAAGFDGYLAKPYRPRELTALVESFLGGGRQASDCEVSGPAATANDETEDWHVTWDESHAP